MDNINIRKMHGYTVQLVADRVWAIDEFGEDIIYLIEGSEKAAVIDTGMGFGNLKAVIDELTSLPYFVLNTHGHMDHAGGNGQFGEAYLQERDSFLIEENTDGNAWKKICAEVKKNPDFYGKEYVDETRPPQNFLQLPIKEHQIFDLGGRDLEAFFTPGHTGGSVVFLDRADKFLFSGDSIVSTPILIFDTYSTNVEEYCEALKELNKEEFDLIFPGHYLRPVGRKTLEDLISCAEQVLDGKAKPEPIDFSHMSSEPAVLYRYGFGSIAYNDKHIKKSHP